MKVHRFYIGERAPRAIQHFGSQRCWVQDKALRWQWIHVLRLRVGEKLVLFDDYADILYEINEIKDDEVALTKVTETNRQTSSGLLLAWGLLKKDLNDFVLQKGTELGVTRFVPLITDRVEKQGFDNKRAERIVIEASEQCERSDIPFVSEPTSLSSCLDTYKEHYRFVAAHVGNHRFLEVSQTPVGILIGPEGGWSDQEVALFEQKQIPLVSVSPFVLRAETAAVVSCALVSSTWEQKK